MTFGELAAMVNGERKLGADLHVIPMKDWQRGDWFDSTGLAWIDPSPNMRSLNAATLYPGVAMLEASKNYRSAGEPMRRSSRSARIGSTAGVGRVPEQPHDSRRSGLSDSLPANGFEFQRTDDRACGS